MLILALAAALVFGAVPTASARAAEMSKEQAGAYFMTSVCASNAAIDEMNREVYGPDNWITEAEVKRRFAAIKAATKPYARSHYKFARALINPPAVWPSSVAGPVEVTASRLLRVHALVRSASAARTAGRWLELMNRAHNIKTPTSTIRAGLDLPPPGEGC
jgi:hypothetical protein